MGIVGCWNGQQCRDTRPLTKKNENLAIVGDTARRGWLLTYCRYWGGVCGAI